MSLRRPENGEVEKEEDEYECDCWEQVDWHYELHRPNYQAADFLNELKHWFLVMSTEGFVLFVCTFGLVLLDQS